MFSRISLSDPRLFLRKMILLAVSTLLLAPLVVEKMLIPAALYVGGLIVLHIVVFVVYLYRVPWRELWQDKAGFAMRLIAIVFFVCLLALLRFQGNTVVVLLDIAGALVLHALIICGLHLRIKPRPQSNL